MGITIKDDDSLDKVLTEIGGFKTYQFYLFFLLSIPVALSAGFVFEFVFASATLDYR